MMLDKEALKIFGMTYGHIHNKTLIKKKYKELAKKFHPDSGGDDVLMAKINLAYEKIQKMKPPKISRRIAADVYNDMMKKDMLKGKRFRGRF